jgi:hypothetical protein
MRNSNTTRITPLMVPLSLDRTNLLHTCRRLHSYLSTIPGTPSNLNLPQSQGMAHVSDVMFKDDDPKLLFPIIRNVVIQ